MCGKCNKTPCCCKKILKGKRGKDGKKGNPGQGVYVYIAYADDVVAGSPDVVTNFSLITPSCWIAIIKSTTPIASPVEADFQGEWNKICCACDSDTVSSTVDQEIEGTATVGLLTMAVKGGTTYNVACDFNYVPDATAEGTYQFKLDVTGLVGNARKIGKSGPGISNPLVWMHAVAHEKIVVPAGPDQVLTVTCTTTAGSINVVAAAITKSKKD